MVVYDCWDIGVFLGFMIAHLHHVLIENHSLLCITWVKLCLHVLIPILEIGLSRVILYLIAICCIEISGHEVLHVMFCVVCGHSGNCRGVL